MRPALALLVVASCAYDPHFVDGKTRCSSPERKCPDGFECRDTDAGTGRSCFRIADAAQTFDGPQTSDAGLPSDIAVSFDTQPDVPSPEVPSDARDAANPDAPVNAPPDAARDTAAPPPDASPDACPPPPGCLSGAGTYCQDVNNIAKCEVDTVTGCVVRQVATRCPQGQCTGTAPNAVCRCAGDPDPRCQGTKGAGCLSLTEIYTCGELDPDGGSNGCIEFLRSESCVLGTACRGDYPNATCGAPDGGATD
jgi:hypothetical protein